MASTYKPADAFSYSKFMIKNMPLDQVKVRILDDVNKIMWMAAPWRWTLGTFPAITLATSTQDYTVAIPSDFLFLETAYEITVGGEGPYRKLAIVPALPTVVGQIGQPNSLAVIGDPGSSGTVRVYPRPGTLQGTNTIYSLYKKTAPTITAQSAYTPGVQIFDDEWFWVYVQGVMWLSYLYGDDNRAGSYQVGGQTAQFSGQRAGFEQALQFMREKEKLPLIEIPGDSRDTKVKVGK